MSSRSSALRIRLLIAVAALVLVSAAPGRAAVINVGSAGPGGGCEASTLEAALSIAAMSSAADEIRLVTAGGVVYALSGSLHLTNWGPTVHGALTVSGGWDSCTDTTPTGAHAFILWDGAGPIFEIDTTAGNTSLVTFRRADLSGLISSPSGSRGLVVQGDSTVVLQDSLVRLNDDGGINVDAGAFVYVDEASSVYDNGPISEGGGIRCTGAGTLVRVDGRVNSNEATLGGGVFADLGCEVVLGGSSRVDYNSATFGGGVWAEGGAQVTSLGGAWIAHNSATSSGGGVGASGASTSVQLAGTRLSFNEAGFTGAGIFVTSAALVESDAGTCAGSQYCPSGLYGNELLPGAQNGAAATVYNGGELRLYQTFVDLNIVPEAEPNGSILFAEGEDATILTESTEVAFNTGAEDVFQGASGASIGAAFTTVGYNRYATGGGPVEARGLRIDGAGTTGRINTSIFYPTAGYLVGAGAQFTQVDCLITQSQSGLPGGTLVFVLDPRYTDPGDHDLRPRPGSPAIDFCDTFYYTPTEADLDGRGRGHNHPTNPNGNPGSSVGTQDAGAYELWELFADGFESGDTSRWSSTTP